MKVRLKPLKEQVIVITGASSGIGLATAHAAAGRGARIVLNSRDDVDLRRVAEEIRAAGGEAVVEAGDVADPEAMRRLAETAVREFGGLDTWVNNAGVSIYGRMEQVGLDDARRLFETNFWGTVHGSLAALPYLRRNGGALINVGSITSETAYPLQGFYSASKHAVKGFTETLRIELENDGAPVSVSLIEPAAIDTPFPHHAKNYLEVEPKHQPPVYAPEIVADAILECAVRPHRTLRVGGSAKAFSLMENLAPGLADRAKRTAIGAQQSDELPRRQDILHAPRTGDVEVWGDYPGRVARTSAYTAMVKRPVTTVLGLAAIGLGVSLAARAFLAERVD